MEIQLQELLQGNATLIKNKEYLSAREYVEPFIDKMAKFTEDFRVHVKLADQLSIMDKTNIIYNRVLIEAVLPEEQCVQQHDEVIGFLYGLDVRKPIAKLYRGYLNRACTNLCVFDPQWIDYQEMQPSTPLKYDVSRLLEAATDIDARLTWMKSTFVPNELKLQNLGEWVDFSLLQSNHNGIHATKLSSSNVVDAYKMVYLDDKSPYYIDEEVQESSIFNIYNAFTQVLTDDKRDIMNKFEKTLLVNQLLKLENWKK